MSRENMSEEAVMRDKLRELGLDPSCDETEKITALWRLYSKSEASLSASLATVAELRSQQAEEMAEFEHYVEHVKSLSAEREKLTAELAAENDELKLENDALRQDIDSYKNDETGDMLLQQGLDDIAAATPSEQVAYLLVERARLMDELEAVSLGGPGLTPRSGAGDLDVGRLKEILDQERLEFEQELRQQRESMNRTREALKASHEEEITALMDENQHLQELLDDAKVKLSKSSPSRRSSTESLNDKGSSDLKRKLEDGESDGEEVLTWKRRVRDVEHINQTLRDDVDHVTTELQREKTRYKSQLDEYEENDRKLRAERMNTEEQLRDLEVQNHKLATEKKSMDLKLSFMERENEDLRQKEQDRASRERVEGLAGKEYQLKELETLRQEQKELTAAHDSTKLELRKEKETILDLEFKVKRAETALEDKQIDLERMEAHLKNKIKSLESQLSDLEDELAASQKETASAKNDARKNYETSLTESDSAVRDLRIKLSEAVTAREELEQELSRHRDQAAVTLRSQTEVSAGQVTRLEGVRRQLEDDNDELAKKLQDSKRDCVQKEKELLDERNKFQERYSEKEDRLSRTQSELDDLQREIRRVTTEMYSRDDTISQLEIRLESEKAASQTSLASLRREIEGLQRSHNVDTDVLEQKLEQAQTENTKLRLTNTEKVKEIERLREEVSKGHDMTDTMSFISPEMAALNRNTPPEKLKEFYKRSAEMDMANEKLKEELDQKNIELSEVRSELAQLRGERNAETLIAQTRADTAEKKLYALQEELSRSRDQRSHTDTVEMTELRTEVRLQRQEVTSLREQLQHERLTSMKSSTSASETSQQVAALKQREVELTARNSELQRLLVDVEARLEELRRQTRSNAGVASPDQASLQTRCHQLQSEVDSLRLDLLKATDRHDKQLQKYSERRQRTKQQLQKARDVYSSEKQKLRLEKERLERDLTIARSTMTKDMEWRESIDTRHHSLLEEKRGLLTQLTEQDELVRDHSRQLSVLQVRSRFLEDENNTLQQRVDSLSRQKQNLDRIIKEYQFERHKEELRKIMTLNTSVLLSPRTFVASVNPKSAVEKPMTSSVRSNSSRDPLTLSALSATTAVPRYNTNGHAFDALISPRVNSKLRNFNPDDKLGLPALLSPRRDYFMNNHNDSTENDVTCGLDEDSLHSKI